jgi:hypothetical protein
MTREWRRTPLKSLKTDSEMAGAGSRDRRWRTRGTLEPPEREGRAEEAAYRRFRDRPLNR